MKRLVAYQLLMYLFIFSGGAVAFFAGVEWLCFHVGAMFLVLPVILIAGFYRAHYARKVRPKVFDAWAARH